MRLSRILTGAILLAPAVAFANPTRIIVPNGTAQTYDFVAGAPDVNDLRFARQVLPATNTNPATVGTTAALAQSRTIYLNYNGVTLSPGVNDARTNRSTIANAQVSIPAWGAPANVKTATTACIRELFAAFDVNVVDTDPGNVPHIEAVFGGSPTALGLPNNVAGVSPFTTDCSIIENSIVFTFSGILPNDARLNCEIQAQEIAHSYGLDHELLASDPMTYLNYNGNRTFKNQTASCGEDVQRPCGINGSTCRPNQNSVALLTERLGTKGQPGDNVAPNVNILSPSNNATVPPGFKIRFDATDNIDVTMATLYIDDTSADTVTTGPFEFTTPSTLSEGQHTFKIEATDGNNVKSTSITVTVRKGAPQPTDPTGGGDDTSGDLTGGCSTGGGSGGLLGLALVGLVAALRRRR
jgi:MYXO-CTERM domain-containing protein